MQAVILAGGLGTRLRPLTDNVPKVMVKIRGNEFLFYLLSWLKRNGIADIVVCAHHLAEIIQRSLASRPFPDVKIALSIENRPLGTAGAIKHARPLLADEFLIINGDTYFPIRYEEVLSRWREVKDRFDCLLVVYDNRERIAPNDTALDGEGAVTGFSKRSPKGMHYVNAGLAVAKKSLFESLPPEVPSSLEEGLYPALIRRRKMAALVTRRRYYDIGTPERLGAFEEFVDRHPEMLQGKG
jgi:NDP-sugar pyrophosphorylase family protein